MAQGIWLGGGGSADPDEITARANDVVQGKTTIDDEGEIAEGTMSLKQVDTDLPNVFNAFTRVDAWKAGGAIDSPSLGRGIITALKPNGKRLALDEQADFVFKPEPDLVPWNVLSSATIAGMKGSIPIWDSARSGHSDVLIAWNDEGHAINHPLWGWGVLSKIPNAHFIKNANWVFLKEPDLLAHNIRQNVNLFGIQGTMPDYGAGKRAFNGATFDGLLLSGVAGLHNLNNSLGFNDWAKSYQYRNDYSTTDYIGHTGQICKTPGIQNGGLYIRSERPSGQQNDEAYDTQFLASYIFSHSINLTPFRTIKVGFKILSTSARYLDGSDRGKPWLKSVLRIAMSVVHVDSLTEVNSNRLSQCKGAARAAEYYAPIQDARFKTGQQMWLEMNVSDLNGHFYMAVGAGTEFLRASHVEMIFNHIEFIN
uniref:Uncharacterized protein n=1 Tax=Siphoviridae sp. ctFiA6 TaxID=2823573 RepID=A0A8S5LG74_9CAUD|nr:MAG TPA: hypothetical protein [Siphoviridae sp. ctFiA6]